MNKISEAYQAMTGNPPETTRRGARESAGSILTRAWRHECNRGAIYPLRGRMLPGGVSVGQVIDKLKGETV